MEISCNWVNRLNAVSVVEVFIGVLRWRIYWTNSGGSIAGFRWWFLWWPELWCSISAVRMVTPPEVPVMDPAGFGLRNGKRDRVEELVAPGTWNQIWKFEKFQHTKWKECNPKETSSARPKRQCLNHSYHEPFCARTSGGQDAALNGLPTGPSWLSPPKVIGEDGVHIVDIVLKQPMRIVMESCANR